jgi:hypothetical protein
MLERFARAPVVYSPPEHPATMWNGKLRDHSGGVGWALGSLTPRPLHYHQSQGATHTCLLMASLLLLIPPPAAPSTFMLASAGSPSRPHLHLTPHWPPRRTLPPHTRLAKGSSNTKRQSYAHVSITCAAPSAAPLSCDRTFAPAASSMPLLPPPSIVRSTLL